MTNASPCFLSAAELLADDSAPRELILDPLFASDSIVLLYGPPGVGKSFVALGIAWAVASGGSFLGWRAPRPRRVLYVDGEMGSADMRERVALFGAPPAGLDFWLADRSESRGLELGTLEGQLRLMEGWCWPDLVVLDSAASLTGEKTGHAERSPGFKQFLRWQKQSHRAVLVVGRANRKGSVRGATQSEDAMDLVLGLRRPVNRRPTDGLHVDIRAENGRVLVPRDRARVVARLVGDENGRASWHWQAGSSLERALPLLRQGLDPPAIGRALGVSRATAFNLQRQARQRRLLSIRKHKETPR
jgi:hypothetical protein